MDTIEIQNLIYCQQYLFLFLNLFPNYNEMCAFIIV